MTRFAFGVCLSAVSMRRKTTDEHCPAEPEIRNPKKFKEAEIQRGRESNHR
jgi:hypothetical protein